MLLKGSTTAIKAAVSSSFAAILTGLNGAASVLLHRHNADRIPQRVQQSLTQHITRMTENHQLGVQGEDQPNKAFPR
jgi:hypothetical protein